jgi:hypothetical protein
MAQLKFNSPFGAQQTQQPAYGNGKQPKPPAEFWLNVGYNAPGAGKDGEDLFVSLPVGIPLDTIDALSTKSSNEDFRMLQAARNSLWEQMLEQAKQLAPGQDAVFDFQIQLRRVRAEEHVPVDNRNKFAVNIDFRTAKVPSSNETADQS